MEKSCTSNRVKRINVFSLGRHPASWELKHENEPAMKRSDGRRVFWDDGEN